MSHTREELNKLSLVELKLLCKEYQLARTGTKSQLIKSILDLEKPVPITVHIPTEYKPPQGKKVIGLKIDEKEKRIQLGKEREKGKVQTLYYSMGVHYYLVEKDFQFV
jgi:hypothetical protein